MPEKDQPPLAITMGEPAGVGPELIARIWRARIELNLPDFIYVGSADALRAIDPDLPIRAAEMFSDFPSSDGETLRVVDVPLAASLEVGTLNPDNGKAVIRAIDMAVTGALAGEIAGMITAPIHKAALYSAGFDAPGHTEYLARQCGMIDNQSVMMLATDKLRVVPVTVHVPLKDVPKTLTAERIVHTGLVVSHDLRMRFGITKPKLAVAGLNPHAGENGTIGMEEATHIMPAIWALRDHGVTVTDPQPADTLFHAEARTDYDAVLCMYHDQALIPLKTLDFWGGVNITLGLPVIRTSPDHGTALSLAGTGQARTDSMVAAIRTAASMAERAQGHKTPGTKRDD